MNLFTRFLRQWNSDSELDEFVEHWDGLERLVIRVYKGGKADPADEAEYQALRYWLQANYGLWQERLAPLWQKATVAGKPANQDPFLYLIVPAKAADFVDAWKAMQHLPAARQALNTLVLEYSHDN